MNADLPIGVFDSGIGGLTVLGALRDLLPGEDLVYLGDTARLPYGTKSPESVRRYAAHAAEFLSGQGIKALVVACNTASALALNELSEALAPLPVIGVVEPGAAAAVAASSKHRYLVLATEATTGFKAYTRAISELDNAAEVEEMPCSLFVALAEEGWHVGDVAMAAAEKYLSAVKQRVDADRPDVAILGCTHFPLLQSTIAEALGEDVSVVDSATTTALAVKNALAELELLKNDDEAGAFKLYATDGATRFARVGGTFLGFELEADDIEIVDIHPTDMAG